MQVVSCSTLPAIAAAAAPPLRPQHAVVERAAAIGAPQPPWPQQAAAVVERAVAIGAPPPPPQPPRPQRAAAVVERAAAIEAPSQAAAIGARPKAVPPWRQSLADMWRGTDSAKLGWGLGWG